MSVRPMTAFSRPLYEQINVPSAQISDLLPAVQLATSASRPGTDYGEAKARFLEAIQVRGLPADRPCTSSWRSDDMLVTVSWSKIFVDLRHPFANIGS